MIRGCKADYDEWEALGNPGWSWNDVLPLFKKVATCPPHEIIQPLKQSMLVREIRPNRGF
jgi:choline dehydrogenase-like flavoprotein